MSLVVSDFERAHLEYVYFCIGNSRLNLCPEALVLLSRTKSATKKAIKVRA